MTKRRSSTRDQRGHGRRTAVAPRRLGRWLPRLLLPCIVVLCLPAIARADDAQPTADADTTSTPETVPADAPDAGVLLREMDELYRSDGTTARVEITIVSPRQTRTMRMRFWGQGEDHALMVIESPPRDAGTATLRVEDNLWNYLPKISRTIRVPPSMMMGSWMGSDLTNDDIVRDTSFEEDYDSRLVGRSEDPAGWLVRLDAKPDLVGLWSRIDIVFDEETRLPLLTRSYDRRGRLSRMMHFEEPRVMDDRLIPTVMRVVPAREEGHSTEFRYLDVEFDVDLPADTFSLSRLERG